ncbi:hypothetical protein BZG36_02493 [Bifiguratus adelaidae]|uniref:C2H2-type domain-containing protein n=1 Tax=Bifiguratus adelaidae TaxID=1938954 RepID=A0A261Y2Q2_9FUNG|nr:hypothetical protein BZG36_02493 [Bifiguratus adelaidae]
MVDYHFQVLNSEPLAYLRLYAHYVDSKEASQSPQPDLRAPLQRGFQHALPVIYTETYDEHTADPYDRSSMESSPPPTTPLLSNSDHERDTSDDDESGDGDLSPIRDPIMVCSPYPLFQIEQGEERQEMDHAVANSASDNYFPLEPPTVAMSDIYSPENDPSIIGYGFYEPNMPYAEAWVAEDFTQNAIQVQERQDEIKDKTYPVYEAQSSGEVDFKPAISRRSQEKGKHITSEAFVPESERPKGKKDTEVESHYAFQQVVHATKRKRTAKVPQRHEGQKGTKAKIHVCDICGRAFDRKWNRDHHTKTHLDDKGKTHPCLFCGRLFTKTDDRNRHERSVHKKIPRKSGNRQQRAKEFNACI